jgi:hypothetical protein
MTRLALALPALTIAALALAGCSTTPDPEPGATSTTAPSPAPEEETAAAGPECLVGDWYISQEQMQSFYDAVNAENEVTITIEGGTGLAFTESAYTYTPEFALKLLVAGLEGTGTIDGGISGDYTADESTITTAHEVSDVTLTVEVAGQVIDGADLIGSILASAPINSAPYECGADGPIIQFDTGSGRVPIQLVER